MSDVRPFRAVRPADNEKAKQIAALPYDVYSREEAAKQVQGKPLSFLNIDRPETFFAPDQDMYAPEVYRKAREEYENRKAQKDYIQEERESYYLYELTMDGRTQTGFVGVTAVSDYENGKCKKHENTVAEKEADRIRHVDVMSAQTGPIFLAFHNSRMLEKLIPDIKVCNPIYDFVTEEGIGQRVWRIDFPPLVSLITDCFKGVDSTYIADGHHRAASAVKVSQQRRKDVQFAEEEPDAPLTTQSWKKNEDVKRDVSGKRVESEYFLSVLFPESELKIMDYNRIVSDLAGMSPSEFLKKIEEKSAFHVKELGGSQDPEAMRPKEKYSVGMYLDGKFYQLTAKPEYIEKVRRDAVDSLDVSILQESLLGPIFGIGDPRTDKRIRFVGGIRGLAPLKEDVDRKTKDGNYAVSFAMYPTSMSELFAVADAGRLMPPKSTWFEPKLRSGLFIHEI